MKKKWMALWLMLVLVFTMLVGCAGSGSSRTGDQGGKTPASAKEELQSAPDSVGKAAESIVNAKPSGQEGSQESRRDDSSGDGAGSTGTDGNTPEKDAGDRTGSGQNNAEGSAANAESPESVTRKGEKTGQGESAIAEDGTYTSKDDVALYLHTYGHLPNNFITKKEAKKLGWGGGSLEKYAPGKCIGGDHFGNYEGVLPDGDYHECDIDTLGRKSRGAKRIIYSDDGRIYYTEDHYETFVLLYGEE